MWSELVYCSDAWPAFSVIVLFYYCLTYSLLLVLKLGCTSQCKKCTGVIQSLFRPFLYPFRLGIVNKLLFTGTTSSCSCLLCLLDSHEFPEYYLQPLPPACTALSVPIAPSFSYLPVVHVQSLRSEQVSCFPSVMY